MLHYQGHGSRGFIYFRDGDCVSIAFGFFVAGGVVTDFGAVFGNNFVSLRCETVFREFWDAF